VSMLEAVEARLASAGLGRYEISSYARPGFESRHNRRYWERRPVLALGPGAVSLDPPSAEAPFGVRRANVRSEREYLERVEAGLAAEAGPPERLDARTARGEAAFLALRTRSGSRRGPSPGSSAARRGPSSPSRSSGWWAWVCSSRAPAETCS